MIVAHNGGLRLEEELAHFESECRELELCCDKNADDKERSKLARAMREAMLADRARIESGEGVRVKHAKRKRDEVVARTEGGDTNGGV